MDMSPPPALSDARKLQVVIGVLTAMFLAALDQTIISPALPRIGAELGDAAFLPWIVSAYFVTGTAVTPLYGKLSDIRGRRPVVLIALGVFLVGSTICALAPSMPIMILGRAVQGLGGGGLIALAQTVIGDLVPPRERARYVAFISMVWAVASVAGPILGGFFSQHLSWTLVFWINLPIGGVAFAMSFFTLRGLPQIRRNHRLDVPGAVLIVGATVAFMLALTLGGGSLPWSSPIILALFGATVVLLAGLLFRLSTASEPLLSLDLFRNRVMSKATAAIFFSMFAFTGPIVYLPIFLEFVLGKDATTAGASLISLLGGSVIGANLTGRSMARVMHYKRMAVGGALLSIVALALLTVFAGEIGFWGIEALLLLLGIGMGPIFPVTTVSVQNAVDPRDLGVATATLAFFRSLGSAIGVAALGAIILAYGGVGDTDLARATGAALEPLLAARLTHAFAAVFAAEAIAMAITLACVISMEERPLRGSAPAAVPTEI
jgi:EmrB/QacA subfamily drug resistance transporter